MKKSIMQSPFMPYIAIFILFLVFNFIYTYTTMFEKVITVKNVNNIRLSSKYLSNIIVDNEGNLYRVSNNLYLMFYKAAELYESIEIGKKYKIKGYGKRIPILGLYKNIYSAEIVA